MDSRTQLNTAKYEIEADRFAINLLVSDNELHDYADFTVAQLSRMLGYQKHLIELKLKDYKIYSKTDFDSYDSGE